MYLSHFWCLFSCRARERPVTPSRRAPAAEERSGPQATNSIQGGRETCSSQQNGNVENGPRDLKALPVPQHGRTTLTIQAVVTPSKEQTVRLALQKGGAHQLPRSTQKEGRSSQPTRSSSPAQHFGPPGSQKAAKAPVGSSTMPQERGVTERAWRRGDPLAKLSSLVKHTHQGHRENHSAQILGKVDPTSCRPQTPCQRGDQGGVRLSNGSLHLAKDLASLPRGRVLRGEMGPCEERSSPCEVLRGKEGHGKPTVRKEHVYTPLPINPAEEQALYQSLEDEILTNIKELEADDNHLPSTENQAGGLETGKGAASIGCNGLRLFIPGLSPLQSSHQKTVYGDRVPRSGVYVPESVVRWPSAGLHYHSVIQELSQTLHQECGGMERHWTPPSSALVNGNQAEKKVLEREGLEEECVGIKSEGAASSHPNQGRHMEIHSYGVAPQKTPSTAANSPESASIQEDAKPPLSKPRRSLKKPERVPSIYKLKLRPKIRPRRDNRPEKRPSKIPTPVSYRLAQRASGGKGQAKAHNSKRRAQSCTAGLRQNKTGHVGGEEEVTVSECSMSSTQGGNSGEKMATAEGKTELIDDEEAWV